MHFLKVLFTFAICMAASTLVALVISGTVFGTVGMASVFMEWLVGLLLLWLLQNYSFQADDKLATPARH